MHSMLTACFKLQGHSVCSISGSCSSETKPVSALVSCKVGLSGFSITELVGAVDDNSTDTCNSSWDFIALKFLPVQILHSFVS